MRDGFKNGIQGWVGYSYSLPTSTTTWHNIVPGCDTNRCVFTINTSTGPGHGERWNFAEADWEDVWSPRQRSGAAAFAGS